jgi:cytochrome c biogenesis protein CcmG/thiol:disulfide interchange protein DsbE
MAADEQQVIQRPPRRRARWIAVSVGASVVALAVVLALNLGTDVTASQRTSLLLGRSAPAVDLPSLDGGRIGPDDLAGKAVIVNFWNTWCVPCRQELPALKQFYAAHSADPDFLMVGIVRDDSPTAVRASVPKDGIAWHIALDPGGKAALDFGTRGQPETFAISPSGNIVGFQWGPSTIRGLEAMLAGARAG